MTRTLLTYGDSNTHGLPPITVPGELARYGAETRWPTVMASLLPAGWHLVEAGLPGRTTQFPDPVMGAHMDGREGLKIALASHRPVGLLTIMLGTNDLKTRFQPSPARIAAGIAGLLDISLHRDMAAQHPDMQVLLIAPPPVKEVGPIRAEFTGAEAHGPGLAPALGELAEARGVEFFDAGSVIETSDVDGVHLEAEAHRVLAEALAKVIAGMA